MAYRKFGSNTPQSVRLTPKLAHELSNERRAIVENQVNTGSLIEAQSYSNSILKNGGGAKQGQYNPAVGGIRRGDWLSADQSESNQSNKSFRTSAAIANSPSYKKAILQKQASSIASGEYSSAGSQVERLAPEVYSPLFTMANLNLPRDRIVINAWCRNFYDLHPIVKNTITLHATYPISKINVKCHDKKVRDFFYDMIEEMDLLGSLGEIALEYWKLGEAFPYAELDEKTGKWKRIIVQNPDYIHVKRSVIANEPVISLRPDSALQQLIMSNNPTDIQLRKQIPEEILFHVRKGNNIPLDNFNVSHLKLLSSPYNVRGTSIIVSVFKDLMLYDKLREAKFAQADGLINPITLIKVGGNTEGEYRPTDEALQYWRNIIEEAQYDKDFKIITHAGVSIERSGASGAVLDISSDIELIIKNLFWGLMVPQAVVDSESAAYASASIGLEVLRQRYFNFRNMLEKWLINKIFAPISEIQNFYEYKNGEKKLIVPEIEWNHMNLYDLQDYISSISSLVASKQASLQTLYRSLGLNYKEERKKIREEMVDDAISQREQSTLSGMSLQQLRSVDVDQDMLEPLPGESDVEKESESGGDLPLPELGPPPPFGEMGGAGAPPGAGVTPPLGPGTPGGPGGFPTI